jgi:probable H4MPT-linked C1 transfer pathway protein
MNIIGWDIGGAHIKAAHLNTQGQIVSIHQQPCPLWKGLEQLQQAVEQITQNLPIANYGHAITMTGELVDLFANRDEGVAQIIAAMQALLKGELFIFAGSAGFLAAEQVNATHYAGIASANWLASASFAAQKLSDGLFIDIGSTTTDILFLHNKQIITEAYSDYQRLISQELVYTGVIRTAVMAVAQTAVDNGNDIGLMAEYFATMADVYRVTGELNPAHDQTDSADGAEKTVLASSRRLSRMIGCDFYPHELVRWQQFAANLRAQQILKIYRACKMRINSIYPLQFPDNAPVIGAGVGRFLVRELAGLLGHDYVDFSDICPTPLIASELSAADCAPAVAVACLLNSHLR